MKTYKTYQVTMWIPVENDHIAILILAENDREAKRDAEYRLPGWIAEKAEEY